MYDFEHNSDQRFEFVGKFYTGYGIFKILLDTFLCLHTLIIAVSSLLSQIAQNRVFYAIFRNFRFLDYRKVKTNFKNIQTTIIDVKFDEESKSELRTGLPCNDKPENREKLAE